MLRPVGTANATAHRSCIDQTCRISTRHRTGRTTVPAGSIESAFDSVLKTAVKLAVLISSVWGYTSDQSGWELWLAMTSWVWCVIEVTELYA